MKRLQTEGREGARYIVKKVRAVAAGADRGGCYRPKAADLHALDYNSVPPSRITATSPSVPGTGTARNRNCPACKNLRRFGGALAGGRSFSEIVANLGHTQKGVFRPFRVGGLIIEPVAGRNPPKAFRRAKRKRRHHAQAKMEKAHSPQCRQCASHQRAPSSSLMARKSVCNENSKMDVRALETNPVLPPDCFCPKRVEGATNRAPKLQAPPAAAAGD